MLTPPPEAAARFLVALARLRRRALLPDLSPRAAHLLQRARGLNLHAVGAQAAEGLDALLAASADETAHDAWTWLRDAEALLLLRGFLPPEARRRVDERLAEVRDRLVLEPEAFAHLSERAERLLDGAAIGPSDPAFPLWMAVVGTAEAARVPVPEESEEEARAAIARARARLFGSGR